MKLAVFILVTIISSSCAAPKNLNSKHCLKKLKKELVGYWSYNKADNTYDEGKGMLQLVESKEVQDCLKTLDKDALISVFGYPTHISKTRLYYMYHDVPFNEVDIRSSFMYIEIDETGRFKMIFFAA